MLSASRVQDHKIEVTNFSAGDVGSGKSVLLVQSVAQALSAGWIVIYAPRGEPLDT